MCFSFLWRRDEGVVGKIYNQIIYRAWEWLKGLCGAAQLRRKCKVSEALNKVMKTLGPEGICPYIESPINMCIPSLRVSSALPFSSFSLSSSFSPSPHPLPQPLFIPSTFSSCLSPSFCLLTHPHPVLLSSFPSYLNKESSLSVCVCVQRAWENIGHQQHGKQTTCFLPRSRVVNVDRNRSGQPCSRIRLDRADSGRKNYQPWDKRLHLQTKVAGAVTPEDLQRWQDNQWPSYRSHQSQSAELYCEWYCFSSFILNQMYFSFL